MAGNKPSDWAWLVSARYWAWVLGIFSAALLLFVAGVVTLAVTAHDPLGDRCDAQAAELPAVVPDWVVFNVTDGDGVPLEREEQDRVARELAAGAAPYSFAGRVVFDVGNGTKRLDGDVHYAAYRIYDESSIPSVWFKPAGGRMCGNEVLVATRPTSEFMIWTHTHEMGHFFGLAHLDDSFMDAGDPGPTDSTVQFVDCQFEILAAWNEPGTPIRPHWEEPDCRTDPHWWDLFWPF